MVFAGRGPGNNPTRYGFSLFFPSSARVSRNSAGDSSTRCCQSPRKVAAAALGGARGSDDGRSSGDAPVMKAGKMTVRGEKKSGWRVFKEVVVTALWQWVSVALGG